MTTERPGLLPRAVYRKSFAGEWKLVCVCELLTDAVNIAHIMGVRDFPGTWAWTDETGKPTVVTP